jgi:hypothetical protein
MGEISRQIKRCYICKVVKPYSDFNKNRTKPDGLKEECRLCQKQLKRKAKNLKRLQKSRSSSHHEGTSRLDAGIRLAIDRFKRAQFLLIKILARKYKKHTKKEMKNAEKMSFNDICDYDFSLLDDINSVPDCDNPISNIKLDDED